MSDNAMFNDNIYLTKTAEMTGLWLFAILWHRVQWRYVLAVQTKPKAMHWVLVY